MKNLMRRKWIYFSAGLLLLFAACENPAVPEIDAQGIAPVAEAETAPAESAPEDEPTTIYTEDGTMKEYTNSKDLHIPAWLAGHEVWTIPPEPEEGEEQAESRMVARFTDAGIVEPVNKLLYPNPITPEPFLAAEDKTVTERVSDTSYKLTLKGTFEYKSYPIYGECCHEIAIDGETVTHNGTAVELRPVE